MFYLNLLLQTALFCSVSGLKASDFFPICHRNDPKLNDCITDTIEKLRPALKTGIKQLQIPSSEPMVVPKIKVLQGSGPVSLDSTFYDLHVEGITNYKVKEVRADLSKHKIIIKVELPYLYVHGDYEMKGQVLVLPIVGSGDSWSNYTGVSGVMTIILKPEERGGKTFLPLQSLDFDISVKHAIIHLNNLFNGNKQLGDAMNRFMSANWQVVFQELKPVVNTAISQLLGATCKKVFDKFSQDELFPL